MWKDDSMNSKKYFTVFVHGCDKWFCVTSEECKKIAAGEYAFIETDGHETEAKAKAACVSLNTEESP